MAHERAVNVISHFADLVARWDERDRRYRAGRRVLNEDEQYAVFVWRRGEIDAVPSSQQSIAAQILASWTPPPPVRI